MNSDNLAHLWYFAPAWMEKFDAMIEDSRLEWHIKNLPLEVRNHVMAFHFMDSVCFVMQTRSQNAIIKMRTTGER